jgi:hypothetical protein
MYHQDVLQSLLLSVLLVTTTSATIYISFISILDPDKWRVFACGISGEGAPNWSSKGSQT